MPEKSVKETKELVVGMLAIAALLAKQFKDGVQAADAAAIFLKIQSDEELKAKMQAAYQDIEMVPGEVASIDFAEMIEIFMAAMPEMKNLIAAIHGQ